jgi:urease accessory protein
MFLHASETLTPTTRAGSGIVHFSRARDRTVITHLCAQSPLKLLSPQRAGDFAHATVGTHGGGLLGGDRIDLRCVAEENTQACVTTQASTKVYRPNPHDQYKGQNATEQNARIDVHDNSLLLWLPDPVTCFAGAHYSQHQRFDLHETASLLLIDSFTSGRWSRGERWAMQNYRARTDIWVDEKQIFRDAIRLDAQDGPIAAPSRMGLWNCFSTVVLVGPKLQSAANEIVKTIANIPLTNDASLIFSAAATPLGAILRIAGDSAERVEKSIRRHLAPAIQRLGQDPWSRKF